MTDDQYDNRPWTVPVLATPAELRKHFDKLADQAYAKTLHARMRKQRIFVPLTRDQEDEHLERLMNDDKPTREYWKA